MAITLLNSPTANAIGPTVNKNAARQNTSLLELSTGTRLVYPSSDPAAAAMTNVLKANVAVIHQCVNNADQGAALTNVASSGLTDLITLNIQGQVLCTQVINGSLDTESRAIAQQSIEAMFGPGGSTEAIINTCRFGDKALLNGEKVNITPANQTANSIATAVVNPGVLSVPNQVFLSNAAPVVVGSTLGMIDGPVEDCTVVAGAGPNTLDITLRVAGVDYSAVGVANAANTVWNLRNAGSGGVITLTGGTGVATPAGLDAALTEYFNIGGAAPANIRTGSLNAANAPAGVTITGMLDASPGVYGLGLYTPTGGAPTLVFSDGAAGAEVVAAVGPHVFFGGKITVTLTATTAFTNYKIDLTNTLDLSFQTGSQPTDLTEVSLPRIDLTSLHYVDMDVSTMEAAAATTEKLKYGMGILNDTLAQIGASQARLLTAGSSAETLEENMKNAGSTYSDANPISSMIDFQQSSILLNNAIASTTPSMSSLRTLSSQIQQTFSSVA